MYLNKFLSFSASNLSVLAGTKDLNDEKSGSRHLVSKCEMSPNYVELNNSDIAVCKMKTPFIMGNNIQPIASRFLSETENSAT